MAIKINFDTSHNAEIPTFVIASRNGNKIGQINNITDTNIKDYMNDCPEISFTVHKTVNDEPCYYWDYLKDFKLVWCREWDTWFEMKIDLNVSDEVTKNISLNRLGESELSQINLYEVEINTESDIARDDYTPSVLFDSEDTKASILHRVLEKAPHYSIRYVDSAIAKIQRTFSFDDKTIKNSLDEIAEEINCIVTYDSNSDENGNIQRTISVYDLESNCLDCGYRGEYTDTCPKCDSKNILEGYGNDTTICISIEDLGEEITLENDADSVKNCFKLEAGDDLMTATIMNCNPNGTAYLWYISDDTKEDMSDELVEKLNSYDTNYTYYQKEYQANIDSVILAKYNDLVTKYNEYDESIEKISNPIIGYPNVMNAYYNTIDFSLYLTSGLMPTVSMSETSAEEQASLLTSSAMSPVAVTDISYISLATADSTVLGMAKVILDSRYQVKVKESSLSGSTWKGSFTVTNYSDEEDTFDSATISVTINDNYETYLEQKIKKTINNDVNTSLDSYSGDITSLFELELADFKTEIKKYSLNSLTSFHDACQSCIDIMIEQGVADSGSWADKNPNLYNELYKPYYNKLQSLQSEMKIRENEILIVSNIDDNSGLQEIIKEIRNDIQEKLDFEKWLGEELWIEFCSYRRDDTYENSNYISDGLNNAELFNKAMEFIETAEKEIYKSANLQHQITTKIKNLLVIKEFEPLVNYFSCGNWLRVKIDDELYKLRLLEYDIDYDSIGDMSVTFSDVIKTVSGLNDAKDILEQAASMSTSYDSVKRQAVQGSTSLDKIDNWIGSGLDMTQLKIINNADNQDIVWDSHGLLCRQRNEYIDSYSDEQLKIINKGLYLTDNNWETSRAGIGNFIYFDPKDKVYKDGYGIIADTICSNLILSKEVGVFNSDSSIEIGEDGIVITTNDGSESQNLFTIRKESVDSDNNITYTTKMYIDDNGNIVINDGEIYAAKISGGSISIGDENGTHASISSSGVLSAVGASITGNITANTLKATTSGQIACWNFNNNAIYKTSASYGNEAGMYFGNSGLSISDAFKVSASGALVATKATISGNITATKFTANGSTEKIKVTIDDVIAVINSDTGVSPSIYIRDVNTGTICIYGNGIEFYTGSNFNGTHSVFSHTEYGFSIDRALDIGSTSIQANAVPIIDCSSSGNFYFGAPNPDKVDETNLSALRGNTVRIYSHSGGAVYLGSSGSTAITSDENMKEIYEVDSRYEEFFMNLKPVLYKYKNNGHRLHIGYGARQVESALKTANISLEEFAGVLIDKNVTIGKDEMGTDEDVFFEELYSLRYEEFGALYAFMLQNALKRITELENQLNMKG